MKNSIRLSIVAVALMFGDCNNSSNSTSNFRVVDTTKLEKGAAYYQCEMHPDKISDTTGTCPVCGDNLIKHTKQ